MIRLPAQAPDRSIHHSIMLGSRGRSIARLLTSGKRSNGLNEFVLKICSSPPMTVVERSNWVKQCQQTDDRQWSQIAIKDFTWNGRSQLTCYWYCYVWWSRFYQAGFQETEDRPDDESGRPKPKYGHRYTIPIHRKSIGIQINRFHVCVTPNLRTSRGHGSTRAWQPGNYNAFSKYRFPSGTMHAMLNT